VVVKKNLWFSFFLKRNERMPFGSFRKELFFPAKEEKNECLLVLFEKNFSSKEKRRNGQKVIFLKNNCLYIIGN
jgi:hypothetical protein